MSEERTDMRTIPPPSTCPVCGLDPATSAAERLLANLAQAIYQCPLDHIWQMRWAPEAVADDA